MGTSPEATHLLEEPGALATLTELGGEWFDHHLTGNIAYRPSEGHDPHDRASSGPRQDCRTSNPETTSRSSSVIAVCRIRWCSR